MISGTHWKHHFQRRIRVGRMSHFQVGSLGRLSLSSFWKDTRMAVSRGFWSSQSRAALLTAAGGADENLYWITQQGELFRAKHSVWKREQTDLIHESISNRHSGTHFIFQKKAKLKRRHLHFHNQYSVLAWVRTFNTHLFRCQNRSAEDDVGHRPRGIDALRQVWKKWFIYSPLFW